MTKRVLVGKDAPPKAAAARRRGKGKTRSARPAAKRETPPRAAEVGGARVVRTQGEVAGHFGVTVHAVEKWAASPGFPRRRDGGYELDAITAWRETRQRSAATIVAEVGDEEDLRRLSKAKVLREETRAQREKLELEKLRGQVLAMSAHVAALGGVIRAFVAVLDSQPKALATRLALQPAAKIETELTAYNGRARADLVRQLEALGDGAAAVQGGAA